MSFQYLYDFSSASAVKWGERGRLNEAGWMRQTVFGSGFGQLMAFINSTVLYWMSFLHCADKNGWKLSTNFDEECLQGKCRNYKEHNHVFLEMAWEQALFINYSGRAFLCPREDWRRRGEVCWGSGINNYRYQTPYRPLTNSLFLRRHT